MQPHWQQPPDTTVYGQEKLPIPLQQMGGGEPGHVPAPRGVLLWGHNGLSPTPSLAAAGPPLSLHHPSHTRPSLLLHLHPLWSLQPGASPLLWASPELLGREGSLLVTASPLCDTFLPFPTGIWLWAAAGQGCYKMSSLAQRIWGSAVHSPCETQSGGLAQPCPAPDPLGQVSRR